MGQKAAPGAEAHSCGSNAADFQPHIVEDGYRSWCLEKWSLRHHSLGLLCLSCAGHSAGSPRTPPHRALPLQSLTQSPGPRYPLPNSFLCAQRKVTGEPDTHHRGGREQGEPGGMRPRPEKESACRVPWQGDR